ncbi:fumarylacetoacetate hydrolase family protein [Trinickia sp.]|uniref:fumarylacetoacetate hydrolase family protein n=1 Tax=Trinickia sp. TaxID=2571163 RepID=UPI003F80D5CB
MALAYWRGEGLRGTSSVFEFIAEWAANAAPLKRLCASSAVRSLIAERGVETAAFALHAPISPRQVYCTIGNYRCQVVQAALDAGGGAHERDCREATLACIEQRRRDGAPYVCLKGTAAVAGPFDPLLVEADMSTLDWEVEIGVVIGRPARNVEPSRALEYVAGYCVVNDITLRERVTRHDLPTLGTDWLRSKSREGWLPAGPWLVPAWQVEHPSALRPWLRLNGASMQDGFAGDMIFSIAEQIAYLSTHTSLQPGDLICTGTPAGIGAHYGRYLRAGDVVEAGVSLLGAQRVVCVNSLVAAEDIGERT